MGELDDFITGKPLKDTHDERYRQQLARLLVNRRGYRKSDIRSRRSLIVEAGNLRALIKVDFLIYLDGLACMVIKFGPGSIVTRRRPLVAISRVLEAYQIPIAVATNGVDAEIVDGASGKVISQGLDTIPSKPRLTEIVSGNDFAPIDAERAARESRIIFCFEVDGSCPCDEDICVL